MTPIPPVKVQVDADHSCNNWKCCFGCKCWKKIRSDGGDESPSSVVITEKVTRTYERHHHSNSNSPSVVARSMLSPPSTVTMEQIELPAHLNAASMAELNQEKTNG